MSSENAPAIEGPSIDTIFARTVEQIRMQADFAAAKDRLEKIKNPDYTAARLDVIEIQMAFKSIAVESGSGLKRLLFTDTQKNSTIEITLATRIRIE